MSFSGAIQLAENDNVATAVETVEPHASVAVRLAGHASSVEVRERIPFGFKLAIRAIPKGAHVTKYGQSIGLESRDIAVGDLVHVHNLEGNRGRGDLSSR